MDALDLQFLSQAFPFWKKLSETEKKFLAANTQRAAYAKGKLVHGGQEKCTGVLAVKEGQLRAYRMSEEGKEITLYRLLDGDVCFLSASCILRNISFTVYVEAETDAVLYLTNAAVFEQMSKKNLAVETFLQETISSRFSDVMWVMEQVVFMKFDRRLAIFLLEQSALESSDTITLTHEQIARHMGSAREVVTRMLKYFQGEGLVSVSRRGIAILNRKGLTARSTAD